MWCAGILNLFGGVLIQKRRAEVALEESGLPYVIVRPGGMERPKVRQELPPCYIHATRMQHLCTEHFCGCWISPTKAAHMC